MEEVNLRSVIVSLGKARKLPLNLSPVCKALESFNRIFFKVGESVFTDILQMWNRVKLCDFIDYVINL